MEGITTSTRNYPGGVRQYPLGGHQYWQWYNVNLAGVNVEGWFGYVVIPLSGSWKFEAWDADVTLVVGNFRPDLDHVDTTGS